MIELLDDRLTISFPEVHKDAVMTIEFQRTLRIPDDGQKYPLPAGLGRFPVRHVDDYADRLAVGWIENGGVMLPMFQSEALWLHFSSSSGYPFAVRVGTGKIDAITGEQWSDELSRTPQNYLVIPNQPWLDGYCVEQRVIRQFVAMPLGAGYTAEEQLTNKAQSGGIQIVAYPMRREAYERRQREAREAYVVRTQERLGEAWDALRREHEQLSSLHASGGSDGLTAELDDSRRRIHDAWRRYEEALNGPLELAPNLFASEMSARADVGMGFAPGGRMSQAIYQDRYPFDAWDKESRSRCFVHIVNSQMWEEVTGMPPPSEPLSADDYAKRQLPWFDYYAEGEIAVVGAASLQKLKSVAELTKDTNDTQPISDNVSTQIERVRAVSHNYSLELRDKTASGGRLWIIGGPELTQLLSPLKMQFAPSGGRATGHRPAWWCTI